MVRVHCHRRRAGLDGAAVAARRAAAGTHSRASIDRCLETPASEFVPKVGCRVEVANVWRWRDQRREPWGKVEAGAFAAPPVVGQAALGAICEVIFVGDRPDVSRWLDGERIFREELRYFGS